MGIHMYNISDAVVHYNQTLKNGVKQSDKHMDGFLELLKNEFNHMNIKEKYNATLQGGILNKRWDLLAFNRRKNFAFEFKSILSSRFGRNFSSRVEEAIGVGFDAKANNKKAKLGYLIVLENDDNKGSRFHDKIYNFCDSIVNDYRIYNSALAIEITGNQWTYIFNSYDNFIDKFNYTTFFDFLGR